MSSKPEINLSLLVNNFKYASTTFETDSLSCLFFGNETKKLISDVVFVPKQTERIQSTLDQCLLYFPPNIEFLGCDDPGFLKQFTLLKLNFSLLETMSAQKLSTRMTTVKNSDILSAPPDGVNVKATFHMVLSSPKGDESLSDSLANQLSTMKDQVASSVIESDDSTLSICGIQKGSSFKTLSKNWKKDSPSTPTFFCCPKLKNSIDELRLKLDGTDLNLENSINWTFSVLLRVSTEISDAELHELICNQAKNVLDQASHLFISKGHLFEVECSTYWLPNHNFFVHVVLPVDPKVREEFADKAGKNLNHSKMAFSQNTSIRLLRKPLKEVNLLVNPHEFLKLNPIGQVRMIQGTYHYHHYMQDNFDDSGWGCAYRSFQTVCSWLKQQGYIDKEVPTHSQIQQCLVDIGDKPSSFVGSKKWIGSTELSFCLETMFGLSSKILTTNSGAEIGQHARQLLYHFENYGGPVMIGGGMLAHTILGVDYNTKTGDCRYLILDPHYTGDESLTDILTGGWCGWKGSNFWNKTDFYNLLLPLTVTVV